MTVSSEGATRAWALTGMGVFDCVLLAAVAWSCCHVSVGHMQGVPALTLTVSDPKQKVKVHCEKNQFVTSYQNQILSVPTNVSLSHKNSLSREI